MNRSLLLIICDFLLLSMLALARFEEPEIQEPEPALTEERSPEQQDLLSVLEMSLEQEKDSRANLSTNLESTAEELTQTKEEAARLAAEKARLEAEARKLAEERARLQQEREQLKEDYSRAKAQLDVTEEERQELKANLQNLQTESTSAKERLALMQERLAEREAILSQAQQQLEQVEQERRLLETEKQTLATQLQVSETEKQIITSNLANVTKEKEKAQEQASTLAQGVTVLAESSTEIQKEIKQLQPKSPSAIFEDYMLNRIEIRFTSTAAGLLGQTTSEYQANAVPVTYNGTTYAFVHADDTPFRLNRSAGRIEAISGQIYRQGTQSEITQIHYLANNPNLLAIEVPQNFIQQTGITPYRYALEPFRFPEAVIIGPQGKYGQAYFKLHSQSANHMVRDSQFLSSMPGEVSPKTGNLVFAKTGEFLGVMLDSDLVTLVNSPEAIATIPLGSTFNSEQAERAQDTASAQLNRLPRTMR